MALSRGEINPLNVLNYRKIEFIPEHFSKLVVTKYLEITSVETWILKHLNSRYAIKRQHIINDKNKIVDVYVIAIEDAKELTMLTLGCPHIHK
jgi:hypothetical protein